MVDRQRARIAASPSAANEQARAALAAMNASGRLVIPTASATMILTLCLPQSRDVNGAA
jgi:3-hydroxybutyrate dehydrogenase